MKVAVTGATGFIGRYLVRSLVDQDHDVVALGRDAGTLATIAGPRVAVVATDYSRPGLASALSGVDAVVHLAGRRTSRDDDPLAFQPFVAANVTALEDLYFAAHDAGVAKFILASSIAVYSGRNTAPYRETEVAVPLNPYAVSKLTGERLIEMWSAKTKMQSTALRLAATYGHGERFSAVLMRFAEQAMAGRPLTVRGNGRIAVDQLYVRDAVSAVNAVLSRSGPGGVFNIGAGQAFTLLEMARTVNDAFDNVGNLAIESPIDADTPQPFMDIGAAASGLGWSPAWPLERALKDFYETWRAEGYVPPAPTL